MMRLHGLVNRSLLALFFLLAMCTSAAAQMVVPDVWTDLEGDRSNFFPFSLTQSTLSSQRYQQIYTNAQFLPLGEQTITRIAFRADGGQSGSFSFTIPRIRITLSTSQAIEDGLSTVFADNIGPDEVVVFDGVWSRSGTLSATAPHDWDFYFDLQTPFQYDPSAGNLLMDLQNFGGDVGRPMDVSKRRNDGISRVYTWDNKDVFSPVGDPDNLGIGLITQFTFVPEPTSLLVFAAFGIPMLRRRA